MKRIAIKLVVFLLLGAVGNVGVAWGCAAWSPLIYDRTADLEYRFADDPKRPASTWPMQRYTTSGLRVTAHIRTGSPPPDDWSWKLIWMAGWPYAALTGDGLWSRVASGEIRQVQVTTGIQISSEKATEPRVLPLRPILPGFAINTLFYAAVLWTLTLGPFAARRIIRRKRGRCAKCGYDLRAAEHDACPECGAEA